MLYRDGQQRVSQEVIHSKKQINVGEIGKQSNVGEIKKHTNVGEIGKQSNVGEIQSN